MRGFLSLAAELIRSKVDVIVTHGTPGTLAAKRATATVPIVMAIIGDPVAAGVVASLTRPGGNITGSSVFAPELGAKRIELLKEMLPRIAGVAVLINRDNPATQLVLLKMETAARSLGVGLRQFPVRFPSEFESVFDKMQQEDVKAVVIEDDGILNANVAAIAALAARHSLLSIGNKEFAQAGGLMGYDVNFFEMFRHAATFVDKILKGTNPADIPIEQATSFDFVLNLKTARVLDLDAPTSLLLRANEVIE